MASVTYYLITSKLFIDFFYTIKNKYLKVYCLKFSERCQIKYLDNKWSTCANDGEYSSHYVSHMLWAIVCVMLTCPHIFLQVCATHFFYTSYVIEMKPYKFVAE